MVTIEYNPNLGANPNLNPGANPNSPSPSNECLVNLFFFIGGPVSEI